MSKIETAVDSEATNGFREIRLDICGLSLDSPMCDDEGYYRFPMLCQFVVQGIEVKQTGKTVGYFEHP